MLKVPTFIYRG